jgi:serine/threonine protein phosphatase 1
LIIAIGDVHGCADELRLLLNKLPLSDEVEVVFLGDYVDRGPRSREVIDTVLELQPQCRVVPLMGNHEAMFLDYLDDPTSGKAGAFVYNGGSATLSSYADERGEVFIPPAHVEFLRTLRLSHETKDYFFVHAGVPRAPLAQLDQRRHGSALLWMRGDFLTTDYDWGKTIVHGHTVVPRVQIQANRICVDTGCVFGRRLSAIALPGERVISVPRRDAIDRVVLRDSSSRRAAIRFLGEVPVVVRRGTERHAFTTVDYSELGMYMRAADAGRAPHFDVGERLEGVVGPDAQSLVSFDGAVVRRRSDDLGVHYAVKIFATRPALPGTF